MDGKLGGGKVLSVACIGTVITAIAHRCFVLLFSFFLSAYIDVVFLVAQDEIRRLCPILLPRLPGM